MTRLRLQIYIDPAEVEVFCNVRRRDGAYERLAAVIDTGAVVSLLPDDLLEFVEYRFIQSISVEQAGIAKQSFEAVEGLVTTTLEDASGEITQPFEIPVWFANTNKALIGFAGVLERAILHIDMLRRDGWLEIVV